VATQSVTVAESGPTVTIALVDGNDVINATEAQAGVPLSGTVSGLAANSTFEVTVTDNGVTKDYVATVNAAGTGWTATIPSADATALANGTATVSAQVTDANGNTSAVATQSVTVAESGPTVTIALVDGNDVINATQTTSGVAISGTETSADGQTVTIAILNSGKQVVDTLTTVASAGAWSVTLSEAQLLALPSGVYTFQADVSTATPANPIVTISRSLEWIATSGGNWAQGSNWSGGVAPTAVDDATVDLTGSYGITVSGAD